MKEYFLIFKGIYNESITLWLSSSISMPCKYIYIGECKNDFWCFVTGLTISMSPCLYNFPNRRYGPVTSTEKLQQCNRAKAHVLTCNYAKLVDKSRNPNVRIFSLIIVIVFYADWVSNLRNISVKSLVKKTRK